jgi:hypothetical protein
MKLNKKTIAVLAGIVAVTAAIAAGGTRFGIDGTINGKSQEEWRLNLEPGRWMIEVKNADGVNIDIVVKDEKGRELGKDLAPDTESRVHFFNPKRQAVTIEVNNKSRQETDYAGEVVREAQ